jgi:hypothetical protein
MPFVLEGRAHCQQRLAHPSSTQGVPTAKLIQPTNVL